MKNNTSVLFNSLVNDLNAGAKRIANNPVLIEQIPDSLMNDLQTKFTNYSPMTDAGKSNKAKALENIQSRLNSFQKIVDEIKPIEPANQPFVGIVEAEKVIQNTVVLELHLRNPGFVKSVKTQDFKENYTLDEEIPAALNIFVSAIDRVHLKPLTELKSQFISWLKSRAMPSTFLANGMYLIPLSLIGVIDGRINDYKASLEILLNEFEAKYEDIIAEAKINLGKTFNAGHYPNFSEIRKSYKVDARYLTLNVPAALEKVNKEMFDKEMEKHKAIWADATEDIRDGLRAGFQSLLSNFTGKLGKDENGKYKTFHGSTVEKLKDFVATFADRNLTNDSELANLADQAKQLLSNVDPKNLRKDESVRSSMAEEFKKIQDIADSLIVAKTRRIELD